MFRYETPFGGMIAPAGTTRCRARMPALEGVLRALVFAAKQILCDAIGNL